MKPDPKICGECSGQLVVERFKDYIDSDGARVSSAGMVLCDRKEVPKHCPMILEHTMVSQDKRI